MVLLIVGEYVVALFLKSTYRKISAFFLLKKVNNLTRLKKHANILVNLNRKTPIFLTPLNLLLKAFMGLRQFSGKTGDIIVN